MESQWSANYRGGCQAGHENRTRDKLFRVDTAMPAGCPIKAKLALRAVGYEGIYHLPGCGSYRRLKRANGGFALRKMRWRRISQGAACR